MEYRILGPVDVRRGGADVPLDGTKQRTVLAVLLIAGGSLVPDDELSTSLWGQHPPVTVNAQLYNHVSRLRKALGDEVGIVRRSPGYLLRPDPSASFDASRFDALAAQGRAARLEGRAEEAGRLLRAALDLWRGPALANVSEHLVQAERPRFEEARLSVLESRIEADLDAGGDRGVLPELTALVSRYPLRERFHALLMTALYRCDRQAEALALYDRSRRMLADELGVEPGVLLRRVHRAILTADPALRRPLDRLVG